MNQPTAFTNQLKIVQTPKYLQPLFFLYLFFAPTYFVLICFILNWHYFWTPLVVTAEAYGIFTTFLYLVTNRTLAYPVYVEPLRKKTIDVLIPTLNEPEDIVAMTTIGALHIRGINKVYVLDDGNREHIKKLAKQLGAVYLARPTHEHAKAGNLNYGLTHSQADFVISLDADHVPQPNFLERLLGYFKDEKLALVQTPQVFYNLHSFQHRTTRLKQLWNEQTMFYEGIQPAKNIFNAAFFVGSSALLRRSALDSVGGFATGTATEDIHTSLRLHAKGWRSLFVNEKLAYGLAPEEIQEYHRQRVRWGAGSLGLLFRSPDSPIIAKGLTLMQRACYLSSTLAYLQGILKLFYYLLPLLFIFALTQTTSLSFVTFLFLYVPFFIYSLCITSLFSRRTFHYFFTDQYNTLNIFSNVESLKGVFKIQKKFGVSKKNKKKKEGQWLTTIVFLFAGVMFLADIYGVVYWFMFLKSSPSLFLHSFLFVQIFWNTINLLFILLVLRFLSLYQRKPLPKHRFIVNQSVSHPQLARNIEITYISLSGAVLHCDTYPKIKELSLLLSFISPTFNVSAHIYDIKKLKDSTYEVHLHFSDISIQQKIELTTYLFREITPQLFRLSTTQKSAEKKAKPESMKVQFEEIKNDLLTVSP